MWNTYNPNKEGRYKVSIYSKFTGKTVDSLYWNGRAWCMVKGAMPLSENEVLVEAWKPLDAPFTL